jgi:hypothetical protein
MLLLGIFIGALVLANLLGTKITVIMGISVSVGIFAYPITFLCTDIVAEVRGKQYTKQFVKIGFAVLVLTIALVALSIVVPPADRYEHNDAYRLVFGNSLRMVFASLVAFVMAQYHDIWAFHFWKSRTKGKWLWFRNNLSTVVSQLIDTTVFMFIAFYMVTPQFTAGFIVSLIVPYWLFKLAFAFLDTPLVYAGVKWLKS